MTAQNGPPFALGSDILPGAAKVIEEMGELQQVLGKYLATGGDPAHWDGSDLRQRLIEELGDLSAAILIFGDLNLTAEEGAAVTTRGHEKYALFTQWHNEGLDARGCPDGCGASEEAHCWNTSEPVEEGSSGPPSLEETTPEEDWPSHLNVMKTLNRLGRESWSHTGLKEAGELEEIEWIVRRGWAEANLVIGWTLYQITSAGRAALVQRGYVESLAPGTGYVPTSRGTFEK